jgi:hypothetical protein
MSRRLEIANAQRAQQFQKARHGDLTLMVLRQHEALQPRPEMARQVGRQRRRQHCPVRHQPALAAKADHVWANHQILHHEVRVALEARAGRHRGGRHDALFADRQRGLPGAPAVTLAGATLPGSLARFLHAARLAGLDVRATFPALQPGDLVTLLRNRPLQLRHPTQQLDHQRLQIGIR